MNEEVPVFAVVLYEGLHRVESFQSDSALDEAIGMGNVLGEVVSRQHSLASAENTRVDVNRGLLMAM